MIRPEKPWSWTEDLKHKGNAHISDKVGECEGEGGRERGGEEREGWRKGRGGEGRGGEGGREREGGGERERWRDRDYIHGELAEKYK